MPTTAVWPCLGQTEAGSQELCCPPSSSWVIFHRRPRRIIMELDWKQSSPDASSALIGEVLQALASPSVPQCPFFFDFQLGSNLQTFNGTTFSVVFTELLSVHFRGTNYRMGTQNISIPLIAVLVCLQGHSREMKRLRPGVGKRWTKQGAGALGPCAP